MAVTYSDRLAGAPPHGVGNVLTHRLLSLLIFVLSPRVVTKLSRTAHQTTLVFWKTVLTSRYTRHEDGTQNWITLDRG